ncbi:GTPase-activating protein CdGAPr, partial [Pseudolycoriella hygida]
SLRTVGHSRSVSHDSYFDLLQSPLRGGVTTCCSRELSELGINFDREEPEMRIFSESESLVSSPKVAKETSRRTLRSRPDDYSNVNNSVNPSPKKQPRLNLQSPNDTRWSVISNTQSTSTDESMCKRYKLEDQLSDIQFIDCSTPEHTIQNPNTIYASVQIHNAPSSSHSSDLNESDVKSDKDAKFGLNRNSYPETKYNEPVTLERKEERFSYPGMGRKFTDVKKYVCRVPINEDVNSDAKTKKSPKFGRFSYCDPNSITNVTNKEPVAAINLILRSCSAELSKQNEMQRSKLSIATPSSPSRSPRYSLLVGDTSSENSSSLNTPVFDMDISTGTGLTINISDAEKMDGDSKLNTDSYDAKEFSTLLSEDSSSHIITTTNRPNTSNDARNMESLKRELSLDLEGSKMSVDDTSLSSLNKQIINVPSTPNTPNYTHTSGNTSQSMTPSEFGYQHLNRQSGAVSLENSPKSSDINLYENLERSFSSYDGTTRLNIASAMTPAKSSSPIRSTINITYNLKSPLKSATHENVFFSSNVERNKPKTVSGDYEVINVVSNVQEKPTKPLLETSFDENMVYEQVKFFKGAVNEVNSMLDNGNSHLIAEEKTVEPEADLLLFSMDEEVNDDTQQVVPDIDVSAGDLATTKSESEVNSNIMTAFDSKRKFVENDDVPMYDDHDVDIQDSLELSSDFSLYENVEYRKPLSVYENVTLKPLTKSVESKDENVPEKVNKQPVNFIVKQLANKFETSPVDSAPFDFTKPLVKKLDTNRNSPCFVQAKSNKQLHKTAKITRSLDENAFEREFGSVNKLDGITKSTQQIPQIDGINGVSRRMSLEYIRPKTLNPPKRLPDLEDNDTEICKSEGKNTLKLEVGKASDDPKVELPQYDVKITPTTENPISLIQHNVNMDTPAEGGANKVNDDDKNQTSLPKVLGNFKLDRERIEKIKEERRHQLSEKFRSESFRGGDYSEYNKEKSKSRIELRELKDTEPKSESLRFKSKSRGDVRSTSKESSIGDYMASGTLGLISNRVRRISDEKNQNECVDYMTEDAKMMDVRENAVTYRVRRFDSKENDFGRDRDNYSTNSQQNVIINAGRSSIGSQRERISPQFSIRDVRTMFESRSQNQ